MNFKKIVACALVTVMTVALLCIGSAFAEEASESSGVFNAPKLPDDCKIVIDGKADGVWNAVQAQKISRVDDVVSWYKGDVNVDGTLKVLWDDSGFYVFVEVDKHGTPVYFSSVDKSWTQIVYTSDCVQFGWALNGEMNWTSPADSTVAYNGGVTIDVDGDLNLGGWFYNYGQEEVKGVMRQTAEDKYTVEIFCSWVEPYRSDVYGAAGVGEGSCFCFDVAIVGHVQGATDGGASGTMKSITSWNMYPYNRMERVSDFGWIVLSEELEYDPTEDITPDETLAGEETPATDTTPSDDGISTDDTNPGAVDETVNGNRSSDKKPDSPKTADIASVITLTTVIALGTVVVIKKKHR